MDPFVAEVRIVGFNFAPRGWAQCNGQILPISQNTALFSLLGTTYGGDGRSTFALPDLQGRVPMQPGQGPGLSYHDLGESAGSETVTLVTSEMPFHNHGMLAANFPGDVKQTIDEECSRAATRVEDQRLPIRVCHLHDGAHHRTGSHELLKLLPHVA